MPHATADDAHQLQVAINQRRHLCKRVDLHPQKAHRQGRREEELEARYSLGPRDDERRSRLAYRLEVLAFMLALLLHVHVDHLNVVNALLLNVPGRTHELEGSVLEKACPLGTPITQHNHLAALSKKGTHHSMILPRLIGLEYSFAAWHVMAALVVRLWLAPVSAVRCSDSICYICGAEMQREAAMKR